MICPFVSVFPPLPLFPLPSHLYLFWRSPYASGSHGRAVGKATGYKLVGSRIVTSPYNTDRLCDPPCFLSNVYRGVKRRGHEDVHSPPTVVEVKKTWILHPLPHTSHWPTAGSLWRRQSQQSFNTLTPFNFLFLYGCYMLA
jgi:hypothetical protein